MNGQTPPRPAGAALPLSGGALSVVPLSVVPLPVVPLAVAALSAVPLSVMHRACFPDDPWDAAAFERLLVLSGVFGHVAWQGGDPAGFILARDLGEEAEILSVGVLPLYRRRGVGRALIETVVADAKDRPIASIVLEVASDNEPARRLYATLGFTQVGRRPRYYRRETGIADGLILRRGIDRGITGEISLR